MSLHARKYDYILTYVCIRICSDIHIVHVCTRRHWSLPPPHKYTYLSTRKYECILTYVRVYVRTNTHCMHIHAGTGLFHLHNNTYTQYISKCEYIHTYTIHVNMNMSYICMTKIYLYVYVSVYIWTCIYFMYVHAGTGLFRLHLQQSKDILDTVFDK